jgi:DNA replication and repair protein RecF
VQLLAESTPIHRVLRRELKTVQTDEYLTAGAVVGFTPDDLGLIRGGPERRRRFLDRAVFNRWPAYLGEARTYQRLLKSRNQLLRQRAPRDLREPFEAQLWLAGARLLSRRHALLAELRPLVSEAFDRIGLAGVAVQMKYKGLAAPASLQAGAAALAAAAEEKLALDQDRGFTSIGPHADDLGLGLGGRSARLYASQGQTRALVLALKVAEIENLRAQLGHAPILLLDDVSSELDPRRNQSFMTYLRERPAQVFLTTTDDTALALSLEGESVRWVMAQGIVKTE